MSPAAVSAFKIFDADPVLVRPDMPVLPFTPTVAPMQGSTRDTDHMRRLLWSKGAHYKYFVEDSKVSDFRRSKAVGHYDPAPRHHTPSEA